MKHLLVDDEEHPNQHKNNDKLCDAKENPSVNLEKCQWKLRQHDQNLPMEGKPLQNKKTRVRRQKINPKEQYHENHGEMIPALEQKIQV